MKVGGGEVEEGKHEKAADEKADVQYFMVQNILICHISLDKMQLYICPLVYCISK